MLKYSLQRSKEQYSKIKHLSHKSLRFARGILDIYYYVTYNKHIY